MDQDPVSVRQLERILKEAGYANLLCFTDPGLISRYCREFQPNLMIMDLSGFPDGRESAVPDIPVLAIYPDRNPQAIQGFLNNGAKDFLVKPLSQMEVLIRTRNVLETGLLHKQIREQKSVLEQKVQERTRELRETRMEIINRLGRAAEYRDNETGLHIIRMSKLSALLAKEIGLEENRCDLLLNTSSMHDIGKIGIPDKILLKPGRLSPEEFEIMKTHVEIGAKMLSRNHSSLLKMARLIVLTHHEKWDGTGYPSGLKGEKIPLEGRICALADSYDAIVSKRVYKVAMTLEEGLKELERGIGSSFDPELARTFLSLFDKMIPIYRRYKD
ncbi:MAG: HD domain-containing phosphohydrolase [bacterium]